MNDEQPFRGARYASLDRAAGPVQELHGADEILDATDPCQCGTCGRWWDDAIPTGVTPAPSGRCPFEYEHFEYEHDDDPEVEVWVSTGSYQERDQLDVEDAIIEHGGHVIERFAGEDGTAAWHATMPAGEMARLRKSFGAIPAELRTLA